MHHINEKGTVMLRAGIQYAFSGIPALQKKKQV